MPAKLRCFVAITNAVDDPPHRQAARYYEEVAEDKAGIFVVTMEHPSKDAPAALLPEITSSGAAIAAAAQGKAAASLIEAIAAARGAVAPPQARVGFGNR
jgi:hypothetical protein